METAKIKEDLKTCLDSLKNSPIVSTDRYHIQLSNLCDTIRALIIDTGGEIESINKAIKSGNVNLAIRQAEIVQERLFQIDTISEVIKEKVSDSDYVQLEDLFYHYKELLKAQSDNSDIQNESSLYDRIKHLESELKGKDEVLEVCKETTREQGEAIKHLKKDNQTSTEKADRLNIDNK